MATVLLTDGEDWSALRPHNCRWYHHLLALIRGWDLDRRLESGADPDHDVLLSLRAAALIAPSRRRRLALTLRQMTRDAERAPHPFDPRAFVARREILQARDLMEETARLLVSSSPVNPMGVAHVRVLLGDGASPLYRRGPGPTLGDRLEAAIGALTEPPVITTGP
jgi:hypothetical protein